MTDEFDTEDRTPYDPEVDLTAEEMDDLFGDGADLPDDEPDEPDPDLSPSCSFDDD